MGGGQSALQKARESDTKANKLFSTLDKSGDGQVDNKELVEAMDRYGHTIKADWTVEEVKAVIKKFDADGDGKMNRKEFSAALAKMMVELTSMRFERILRSSI